MKYSSMKVSHLTGEEESQLKSLSDTISAKNDDIQFHKGEIERLQLSLEEISREVSDMRTKCQALEVERDGAKATHSQGAVQFQTLWAENQAFKARISELEETLAPVYKAFQNGRPGQSSDAGSLNFSNGAVAFQFNLPK